MLTAAQKEERRKGIGGSDVAAILGISPWKTALDVYMEKVSDVSGEDDDIDTPIYWGSRLEKTVIDEYVSRTGYAVSDPDNPFVHGDGVARANLDGIVEHEGRQWILECKTAGRMDDSWGEPWSDEVPSYYASQVMHYMAVTGLEIADIAVLFLADRRFAIYRIHRDDDLCAHLLDLENRWWNDHVIAGVPPEPVSVADMAKRWPSHSDGAEVVADANVEAMCAELARIKSQIAVLEKDKASIEAAIKKSIGEAEALVSPAGEKLVTWKATKPRSVIDWPAVVDELASKYGEDAVHVAIERHKKEVAGSRRFLLKVKGE